MKLLLTTTKNPSVMNNAAYTLADAKLELPLDIEKIQAAINKNGSRNADLDAG